MRFSKRVKRINYDPNDRKAWKRLRDSIAGYDRPDVVRFGGSDTAAAMGASKYKSRAAVWFEHTRQKEPPNIPMNLHMYRGIHSEEMIAMHYWPYFDPDKPDAETMLENAEKGNVIRECRKVYAMLINERTPWLFSNVDRAAYAQKGRPKMILEIKSPLGSTVDSWESGLDPAYTYQLQQNLITAECEYGEVFILEDNTVPRLFPFELDINLAKEILERTKDLEQRILAVKKLTFGKTLTDEEFNAIAHKYEPEPEMTPQYIEYLKEIYKPENAHLEGDADEEFLDTALVLLINKQKQKDLAERAKIYEAMLRTKFRDDDGNMLKYKLNTKFGGVSWKSRFTVPSSILKNAEEAGYVDELKQKLSNK